MSYDYISNHFDTPFAAPGGYDVYNDTENVLLEWLTSDAVKPTKVYGKVVSRCETNDTEKPMCTAEADLLFDVLEVQKSVDVPNLISNHFNTSTVTEKKIAFFDEGEDVADRQLVADVNEHQKKNDTPNIISSLFNIVPSKKLADPNYTPSIISSLFNTVPNKKLVACGEGEDVAFIEEMIAMSKSTIPIAKYKFVRSARGAKMVTRCRSVDSATFDADSCYDHICYDMFESTFAVALACLRGGAGAGLAPFALGITMAARDECRIQSFNSMRNRLLHGTVQSPDSRPRTDAGIPHPDLAKSLPPTVAPLPSPLIFPEVR